MTDDAQRIERLIEDLRSAAAWALSKSQPNAHAEVMEDAAKELARLRVDAERMRNALTGVLEWC